MARRSMRDTVYLEVKERIVRGRYRPGQHLVESAIADDLETSKTPVREALGKLEQEGLVEAFPYRGYFVRAFDQTDLKEIYELRGLYEGACARSCAESADHQAIAERLSGYNKLAEEAFNSDQLLSVHENFAHFDEVIFGHTENQRLREQIASIADLVLLGGAITNRIPGRVEESLRQHEQIINAISDGDGDAAEKVMRQHVRSLSDEQASVRFAWPM
ncbi:MAG: GntR family transcriptional regulator [Acidimicrobiia bacterium]